MKRYNLNYWLSREFKSSEECLCNLESIIENNFIYKFIDWTDESYQRKKQNIYIEYDFDNTYKRNIDAKLYCGNSRFINIIIHRSGNEIIIVDKHIKPPVPYCNNYIKENVDVYKISHNVDNTSYYSHKQTEITNTGYEKSNHISSIHTSDDTGNVISYYDSEEDKIKPKKRKKHKIYTKYNKNTTE